MFCINRSWFIAALHTNGKNHRRYYKNVFSVLCQPEITNAQGLWGDNSAVWGERNNPAMLLALLECPRSFSHLCVKCGCAGRSRLCIEEDHYRPRRDLQFYHWRRVRGYLQSDSWMGCGVPSSTKTDGCSIETSNRGECIWHVQESIVQVWN